MKKLIILLIIILGISLVAYAGATKYELVPHVAAVADESGWVIINTNPQMTILNFQVKGLPVGQYWAYYWDYTTVYVLEELKVNNRGSGHLNAHVSGGISEPFQVGVAVTAGPIGNADVVLYVNVP